MVDTLGDNVSWLTRLNRYLFGPKIGDIYRCQMIPHSPFQPIKEYYVKIIELRQGWVQFRYLPGLHTTLCHLSEREIASFCRTYKFFSNEQQSMRCYFTNGDVDK